jgi:hypothetical protein
MIVFSFLKMMLACFLPVHKKFLSVSVAVCASSCGIILPPMFLAPLQFLYQSWLWQYQPIA